MKKLLNEWQNFVNEEIYGTNGVVYHAASDIEDLKSILNSGFSKKQSAESNWYGQGLYTVYELEGSNTKEGIFGRVILKFRVNFDNPERWLILNEAPQKKIYGETKSFTNVIKFLDIKSDQKEKILSSVKLQDLKKQDDYEVMQKIYEILRSGSTVEEIDGAIFSDPDGEICLVYNPEKTDLLAWRKMGMFQKGDKVKFSEDYIRKIVSDLRFGDDLQGGSSKLSAYSAFIDYSLEPLCKYGSKHAVDFAEDIGIEVSATSKNVHPPFGRKQYVINSPTTRDLKNISSEMSVEEFKERLNELNHKYIDQLKNAELEVVSNFNNSRNLRLKIKKPSFVEGNEFNLHPDNVRFADGSKKEIKNWQTEFDGQDIIRTIKKNKKQQSKNPDLPG